MTPDDTKKTPKSIKRRELMTAAAAIATGTTTLALLGKKKQTKTLTPSAPHKSDLASPNLSKSMRQFRLVTSWPKDFPGLGEMPKFFSKAVNEASDGRLEVKVYAAGELVGGLECFDAVANGGADFYHSAEYYWVGKSKAFSFFTAVPLGMTATEIMGWVEFGGGQQLWDKLSESYNIKPFQCGNTGHQTGGWFKKEINSMEDFRGLKIRMPGIAGDVIRRVGGAAVNLSGGEIYQSLQSGAIDATEWVGPWNDLAFGFYREAPYYYAPGFHEPGAALAIGANLDMWNSLPQTDQSIIKYACHYTNNMSVGQYTHENALALNTLKVQHGIEPRFFSDEIVAKLGETSLDVVRDMASEDAQTGEIYQSFDAALRQYRGWTEMGEGRYIEARRLAFRQ